jgi:hypothetical protein
MSYIGMQVREKERRREREKERRREREYAGMQVCR